MKLFLFILFSFFLALPLHADSRVKVKICNNNALSNDEFRVVTKDAATYLRRHISKRIRLIRCVSNLREPQGLEADYDLIKIMEKQNDANYALTHYVYSPTYVNNIGYVYGWAWTCNVAPHTVGYSTARLDLYWESVTAIVHEIVHGFGGKHWPYGLMRPNVLAYAHDGIPLPSARTLYDIKFCGKV